jgi:hypothetical protein
VLGPEDRLRFFEVSRSIYLTTRHTIRPGYPGTLPVLWFLKSCVPVFSKIPFGTPNGPDLSESKKYDISDSSYEHFAFPKVGENIFRSRRAIKRLLTGIGEGEEDVWISG